jgi:ketosteroid isomerase-like protein
MSIFVSLLAVTAACTPAATPAKDNAAIVRSFFAAIAANDDAAIGALLKPGARYTEPDDSEGLLLDELLSLMTAQKKGGLLKLIDVATTDKPHRIEIVTQAEDDPKRVGVVELEGGCIVGMASR